MSRSPTSTSSTNSSYNPSLPSGSAEIPNSDTSPDPQSSARYTPISRDSSSDYVSKSHTQGDPPSHGRHLSGAPDSLHHMEDERKGKDVSRNTSPSASSQGEMADNEAEAGPSTQPAEQSTAAPPPKKKRTRTLTTPHQAAVLHALLAQSRFPTTAMREEVGRSIGLSARKVQIWFQNQRQKARRPRGQNVPPLSRPPQYGPFQNIPSGSTVSDIGPSTRAGQISESQHPLSPSGHRSAPSSGSDVFSYRDSFSSEGRPQLSGPGVPGDMPSSPPSPRAIRSAPYPRPDIRPMSPLGHPSLRPFSADDRPRVIPRARAMSPQPRQSIDSALAALTLPPLTFDRPRSYTVSGSSSSGAHALFTRPPVLPQPMAPFPPIEGQGQPSRPRLSSLQSDSPFAYEAPIHIPPPFTLQPRPQWDDASFSPFHRPHARNPPSRIPHEPFTLPPTGLPQEGTTLPLAPPRLTTLPTFSSISTEAVQTSSTHTLPDPSRSTSARHRRYDEDDAQSHDQDVAP